MNKLVYIASPLSGDVEKNLDFARKACRYAISQNVTPFAPRLLYPQMLDDSDPAERQLGIDMGNQMLELCRELWLCGDRISAGLTGSRSGLFMEQIRIIKEMRDEEKRHGWTGVHVRPRFAVWENVPGCLSSGRDPKTGRKRPGSDFRQVLEAFLQIEEPELHVIEPPGRRWKYSGAILGNRSTVAWVRWDAQYLGVPQRRRRIFLICDFAGGRPIQILFDQKSLPGYPAAGI